MAKRKKGREELTTKMHSELSISNETNLKHVVFTALDIIDSKLMTRDQAMQAYSLKDEDLLKFEEEWSNLNES